MGIWEDSATGTAAGPLVARLVAAGKVPDHTTAIVAQGYALGCPSRMRVTVSAEGRACLVIIGDRPCPGATPGPACQ